MKLIDHTVAGFLDALASNAPAPGGGSVSALCSANGAALTAMVARLTVGRKKYLEFHDLMEELIPKADALKEQLTAVIDEDTDAYLTVSNAYKLPKETEEEKAARAQAIDEGMQLSTRVPLKTMNLTVETLRLAEQLVGKSNVNAASDLGVAALNLKTGLIGAYYNVRINLDGLASQHVRADFAMTAGNLYKEGIRIADAIIEAAEKQF